MTNQLNKLIGSLCNEIKDLRNELNTFRSILEQPTKEVAKDEKKVSVLPISSPVNMDKKISDILIDLQVAVNLKGFRYLKDAIKMYIDQGSIQITKVTYPSIAKKYNDSPDRVERAIRHAIETSWHKSSISGSVYLNNNMIKKPTNSEFIALVAEKLMVEKQEESA